MTDETDDGNCWDNLEESLKIVAAAIRQLDGCLAHFETDTKHSRDLHSQLEQSYEHLKAMKEAISGTYLLFRPALEYNNGFFTVEKKDTAA